MGFELEPSLWLVEQRSGDIFQQVSKPNPVPTWLLRVLLQIPSSSNLPLISVLTMLNTTGLLFFLSEYMTIPTGTKWEKVTIVQKNRESKI